MEYRCAAFDGLSTAELYAVLRLRAAVFVVEQDCAYQDVDGRDQESWHLLGFDRGELVAYLRWYDEGGDVRIGRVVTGRRVRRLGLGHELLRECLRRVGERSALLHAQVHLRGFYERHGFVAEGDEFDEDGIPHVAMRRLQCASGEAS